MVRRTGLRLGFFGFLLAVAWVAWVSAQAKELTPADGMASISVAGLPAPGAQIYERVLQGGPFAYEKDGVVFGNREKLLPAQKRGYYREYTVKTPGAHDRGARRIVCGGQPRTPDICYYTDDHYASFRRIVP